MQLPSIPSSFHGATPFSMYDAAGTLWVIACARGEGNHGVEVYRVVGGKAEHVRLDHDASARGSAHIDYFAPVPGLYVTAWDDKSQGGGPWRMLVPDFVMPAAPPTPPPIGQPGAELAIALPGREAYPNRGLPYASNLEVIGRPDVADQLKDGWLWLRLNKMVNVITALAAAVAQLQRLARQRGELQ